jgi:hypothetical protein
VSGPGSMSGGGMRRKLGIAGLAVGWGFFLIMMWPANLDAFYISETQEFQKGPYTFKMEIQVYGRGSPKKNPLRVTSVKVKIKNKKASSEALKVKAIRAFTAADTHRDIETLGYTISPSQWVTKFYRLPKDKQPLLSGDGFFQVDFERFAVRFSPRDRQFHENGAACQK